MSAVSIKLVLISGSLFPAGRARKGKQAGKLARSCCDYRVLSDHISCKRSLELLFPRDSVIEHNGGISNHCAGRPSKYSGQGTATRTVLMGIEE
jgi:hypothetical protein